MEDREIPASTYRKWRTWRRSAIAWKTAHYVVGFLSAILSTIVAINTKTAFFGQSIALVLASFAAGASFLVTTMGAQPRAKALEQAAWELEKAMAVYRTDRTVLDSELGKAEARGVDILKAEKS